MNSPAAKGLVGIFWNAEFKQQGLVVHNIVTQHTLVLALVQRSFLSQSGCSVGLEVMERRCGIGKNIVAVDLSIGRDPDFEVALVADNRIPEKFNAWFGDGF
jgi:tRNA U34 5-methylaminomethyl-2-thiouridine-forming methyltransferase MnmC